MNLKDVTFITDAGSYYLFKDLCKIADIKKYIIRIPNNVFLKNLYKLHTNKRLAKYLYFPCRDIWFDYDKVASSVSNNGIVIINSSAMTMPSIKFWQKLRKEKNLHFFLILVDSMHGHSSHMLEMKKRMDAFPFEMIMSYDKADCDEYNFVYIGLNYYSKYTDIVPAKQRSDLYYISSVKKGRKKLLQKIYRMALEKDINVIFKIYSLWRFINYGKSIREVLPYEKVLSDVLSTNCILEILQEGQTAQSLRYLEAITYNKKLLTNNLNVDRLPFYDERYMKCFASVDDIDWEWVKRHEYVDYEFNEDISSRNILKYIEDWCKNKIYR